MKRALLVVAMASTSARAEPSDLARPLVLDRGQLHAELVADMNLHPGQAGRPTSLAPDAWFGVTPALTIGLVHSHPSVDRFSPGASLCVVHERDRCTSTYHGGGLDVVWSARAGELAVAPRARLLVRQLDPVKPALLAGALVRWTRGRFSITGDPYLQLGLANRDRGNRAWLFLPVRFAIQPLARWELALRTGFHSELATIGDAWHVPVALATRAQITAHVDVGTMLAFATLLGPQNTAKERALFFFVAWRG